MKNIEIKFHTPSLSEIRSFLHHHPSISFQWEKEQIDVYFRVNRGRLKLRFQTNSEAELIFYQRNDDENARLSKYFIYHPSHANLLKDLLENALGIRSIVKKKRTLYQFKNVRIHLDDVDHLGSFLECEAVIDNTTDEETSGKNLSELLTHLSSFSLTPVAQSYVDLVEKIVV